MCDEQYVIFIMKFISLFFQKNTGTDLNVSQITAGTTGVVPDLSGKVDLKRMNS